MVRGACDADRALVSGVCLPVAAPRLIAPLSTSRVTSRTPLLHWALGSNTDGAHIELCRDRACSDVFAEFDAEGGGGAPPAALPVGVVFWRAYGRAGAATGLTPSPTWQFTVGARSAPVDSSWGTTPDFNGDGYADVIFNGHIYLGNSTGVPSSPIGLITPNDVSYVGSLMASAGDVNGDGYADLIVDAASSPAASTTLSFVYLYLGGPQGIAAYPATIFDTTTEFSSPSTLAGVGDTNGDGYADVAVSNFANGRARLYFGGPRGLSTELSTPLNAVDGTPRNLGRSVVGAGDVNGDGFADILATNGDAPSEAYIFLGSAMAPGGASITLLGPAAGSGVEFGRSASGVDDLNGDGYADVMVGEDFQNHAYIYLGTAHGPAPTASIDLLSPDSGTALFGFGVSGLGDTNGDGFDDAVVGTDQTGRVYVYLGGEGAIGPAPSVMPTRPGGEPYFGFPVTGAGDVDGDGFEDLLVGGDALGYLFRGSPLGVSSTVSTTLTAN